MGFLPPCSGVARTAGEGEASGGRRGKGKVGEEGREGGGEGGSSRSSEGTRVSSSPPKCGNLSTISSELMPLRRERGTQKG